MNFNELVTFYDRIAATRKRLEITDILAELFQLCREPENQADLRKVIYLTQGRLVSEIEDWPKFGIAEKMVIQALMKFTGKSQKGIKAIVNAQGDAGEAAEIILKKQSKKKVAYSLDSFTAKPKTKKIKDFPISTLYGDLKKLAGFKGSGSQDQKINLLNGILRKSTPTAAKYIINIILSNLRIGLADMTILDSLALAFTGDKSNRAILEHSYSIYPDLGDIAEILATKGLDAVQKIQIQVGIPIRMMLASRIQYPQIQQKLGGGDFVAEYKYDGERVQAHKKGNKVTLFSRQLKRITNQYPDVVKAIQQCISADDVILEGEIVAMDPFFEKMLPFQVMSTRRRKYDIEKMVKEVPVCLFCFDILYCKDSSPNADIPALIRGDIMKLPFLERRAALKAILKQEDMIQLSTSKTVHSTQEMIDFFNKARAKGAEGIMNKALGADSVYHPGNRGFLWIKLKGLEGAKMRDTIDVVIIGASWGKGRRKGFVSPVYGAVYNDENGTFEFLTRVGSGFSDEDLDTLTSRLKDLEIPKIPKDVRCLDTPEMWVRPEIIIEVMGDELTVSSKANAGATVDHPSGYGLRFPVYQRERLDKSVHQITTSREIVELYNTQDKNDYTPDTTSETPEMEDVPEMTADEPIGSESSPNSSEDGSNGSKPAIELDTNNMDMNNMNEIDDWKNRLPFFESADFDEITRFLGEERKNGKIILPKEENIFNAMKYTKFDELKVVILGQDPYPNQEHAMGLSFSIPKGEKSIPASLRNIKKELKEDVGVELQGGDLSHWAKQGVLLLNTSLTVEAGKANSHKSIGWKKLTKEIIDLVATKKEKIVFILWGNFAQKMCKKVDETKHCIIKSPHPSPLSSYRGFFGSKPFSKTNEYLEANNFGPIDWSN